MSQVVAPPAFKSPLHEMTQTTPTCLWNDSASIQELTYSIEHGAVGATCNPVIVLGVLKKEMASWKDRLNELIRAEPPATEEQISWQLVRDISAKAAALLRPIFDTQRGRNGRLSIQTDPRFYRDSQAIVAQAIEFSRLAPNMIVKIPVTRAGIPAIEEATHRGVSINATVCFTLPQCVAVAEAVERGLTRRQREGLDIASMGPVCTIMWAATMTGSRWSLKRRTSPSIPAISSGRGWQFSKKPTDSLKNGATGSACFRLHFAIICTGAK